MDYTADPCVDFFQYACGTWNKKHVIPEDRSSISTFEVMADQLQVILKGTQKKILAVAWGIGSYIRPGRLKASPDITFGMK